MANQTGVKNLQAYKVTNITTMITQAIESLNQPNGSSLEAIVAVSVAAYELNACDAATSFKRKIAKLLKFGAIVAVGVPAARTYKIGAIVYVCWRCQKEGHLAGDCKKAVKMEKPVKMEKAVADLRAGKPLLLKMKVEALAGGVGDSRNDRGEDRSGLLAAVAGGSGDSQNDWSEDEWSDDPLLAADAVAGGSGDSLAAVAGGSGDSQNDWSEHEWSDDPFLAADAVAGEGGDSQDDCWEDGSDDILLASSEMMDLDLTAMLEDDNMMAEAEKAEKPEKPVKPVTVNGKTRAVEQTYTDLDLD